MFFLQLFILKCTNKFRFPKEMPYVFFMGNKVLLNYLELTFHFSRTLLFVLTIVANYWAEVRLTGTHLLSHCVWLCSGQEQHLRSVLPALGRVPAKAQVLSKCLLHWKFYPLGWLNRYTDVIWLHTLSKAPVVPQGWSISVRLFSYLLIPRMGLSYWLIYKSEALFFLVNIHGYYQLSISLGIVPGKH